MTTPLSFTRQAAVRYPAPDVARGFMLLLIAFANVTFWAGILGPRPIDSDFDGFLVLLRIAFVDQRAYPLFALLFGYGLMTMVKRRRESFVAQAAAGMQVPTELTVPQSQAEFPAPHTQMNPAEVFRRDATTAARRLLRRRAWWMLLFGAIHGVLFPGDIIGTYAIIALIFAGVIASENTKVLLIIGGIFGFLSFLNSTVFSVMISLDPTLQQYVHPQLPLEPVWYAPARNLGMWFPLTLGATFGSMAILCVAVGAYLATTSVISQPQQHRVGLGVVAGGGLLVAFTGSLPYGLMESELVNLTFQWWMMPLNQLAGLAGAAGWLALWTLFAGPAPMTGQLRGLRWVLSAVGRRSMTSYVLQSVLFALVFLPMYGTGMRVSELSGVLVALGAWLLTVALAVVLEFVGKQGPLERALRFLVLRGERRSLSAVAQAGGNLPSAVPVSGLPYASEDGQYARVASQASEGPAERPVEGPVSDEGRPFSMS